MDKNTISLLGIVDTLDYLLETDAKARRSKNAAAARKRLKKMHRELLKEGLRQSQVLGSARDSIFEISYQLGEHLSEESAARNLQWVVHGLLSVDSYDVQPPPLPSSSSGGPKSAAPEVIELAEALNTVMVSRSKPASTPMDIFIAKARQTKPGPSSMKEAKNGKVK